MRVRTLAGLMVVALGACGGGQTRATSSATTTSTDASSTTTTTTQLAELPTLPPEQTSAAPTLTTTKSTQAPASTVTTTSVTSTTAAASVVAQGGTADLHITLTVSPSSPHRGQTVDYVIDATDTQSRGALNRSLDYGDGQQAPLAASPQICAGQAQTQHQRWDFQHAYNADGTFTVVARVTRVCGQGMATASLMLVVSG